MTLASQTMAAVGATFREESQIPFVALRVVVAAALVFAGGLSVQTTTAQQQPATTDRTSSAEDESVKRLRQTAAGGDARAQFELGLMYETGEGVSQNVMNDRVTVTISLT